MIAIFSIGGLAAPSAWAGEENKEHKEDKADDKHEKKEDKHE